MLATINTVDFIYVCDTRLTDPGFATRVDESGDGAKKLGLSPEEIAKVKEEWEERQKKKQEKIKEKEKEAKDKDEKDKEKDEDKDSKKKEEGKTASKSPPPTTAPSTPAAPTHQRYTLHRDIFSLRLAEHRKRKQTTQARALAPRLPGAPKSPLPSSS